MSGICRHVHCVCGADRFTFQTRIDFGFLRGFCLRRCDSSFCGHRQCYLWFPRSFAYSLVGALIFCLYILFDTWRIIKYADSVTIFSAQSTSIWTFSICSCICCAFSPSCLVATSDRETMMISVRPRTLDNELCCCAQAMCVCFLFQKKRRSIVHWCTLFDTKQVHAASSSSRSLTSS